MDMNDYQDKALETFTASESHQIDELRLVLGLSGEVGEVAEKYKKELRDKKLFEKEDLRKELGDVMWYLAVLAAENDISMDSIAVANIKKLASRKQRGKLSGSGDNR